MSNIVKILLDRIHRDETIVSRLNQDINECRTEIKKEAARALNRDHTTITMNFQWACKDSPVNYCVYETEDTCMDFCLYCDEPNERK